MGQQKKKFKLNMMYVVPVLVIIGFIALCYVGSLLLMHLNGLPLEKAGPFTAFRYFPIYKNSPVKSVRLTVIFCAAFPFLVSAGIAVLFYITKYKPRALHGDARFATYMEIKKAGLVARDSYDKTILVGQYKEHGRNEYLCYGGYQFVMLAAPTRSGKGVGVVIPNCLNYSDSLVVLDIKLENFDKTSGFRAKSGQEVYLFAPYDECESERQEGKPAPMRTHRYNPLGYVSSDPVDRIGDIDSIAQAFYNNPNSKDKFFDEQAKDLFRGITMLVLETPGIPHTLGEVFRQSSGYGKALPEHLNEMIEKAKSEGRPYSDECVAAISRVCTLSDNTFAGVKGSMQVPLMPWANARVDASTSANDFDLRDVRKKRMTIYVGITPNKLAEAKNIINLFFDQLINLNTKTLPQQDKSLKYQCLMILDEFTAAGKINQIAQSISYQAGYNMRVLTIIQNKSQLEDVYGKPGALTLMSNHALMIMYAPSPVVQSDANEYSEMLGYQTVKNTSHSRSFGKQGSRSDSTSDQKRALMLPQELKEMDMWEEIVSLEHTKPIRCGKIKYFEDPTFTARVDWQIPEIPLVDLEEFMQSTKAGAKILSNTSESENEPADLDQIGKNDVPSQDEIISRLDQIPENKLVDVISLVKQSSLLNKLSIPELKMNYGGTSEDSKKRMLSDFFESSPDDETLDEVLEQSDLSEDEQETLSLMQEFTVDENSNSQKGLLVSEEYKQVQAADVLAKFGFSSIKESDEIPEDLDSINAQLESLFGNALSA
ncbi:type IV secretory system conjugative DNA transfer family protein [Succinivibrio faecicola]|uniref:Type IV secretory system conjugative DNA transfer family protein n=1 Tax=Succinivibrio faecicola TaxID=2820300 RepID=A0ABS7DG36_9GAMM|nr:type IV secretory system conjugative DNA transfer family protein [Succinivibrio faecicola]MBW7570264.1 type IV secretory system conjugative DNA transfer family protein [Succinivibrio faecicola]